MTTAVVTITCPSCGGRAENVQTTDEDQTIKCAFCGTELHIPRIGEREIVHERVVREVVHEVDSGPAPGYEYVVRKKQNPVTLAIIIGIGMSVLLVVMCVSNQSADDETASFEKQRADDQSAEDTCKASCKQQCAHAGDQENGKWDRAGVDDDHTLEQQTRDADVLVCSTQCETDHDCYGVNKLLHH
ncbi:MAG TPA: hypothetical protein VGG74_12820 [Kofleriaceae bacterium]|jgi:ribosomal protein S27E